jgi:hypothetical protein
MPLSNAAMSSLRQVYNTEIDALINQLGKDCLLYFEDTIVFSDTAFSDDIRPGAIRKPVAKSPSSAPLVTNNTRTVRALIQYNPSDFKHFDLKVDKPEGIVRLKTFLTDVPDILKCKYMIPSINSKNYVEARYRLLREPIPKGLQLDRYAVSFWERI